MGLFASTFRPRLFKERQWYDLNEMTLKDQVLIWFITNLCLMLPLLVGVQLFYHTLRMGPLECICIILSSISLSTKYDDTVKRLLAGSNDSLSVTSLIYFATFFGLMGIISFVINIWIMKHWIDNIGKKAKKA